MTASDVTTALAADMLRHVASLLDGKRMAQLIDEPLDKAIRGFRCGAEAAASQQEVLDYGSRFLRHVYAQAFPKGRQLTYSQGCDEVIALLEEAGAMGLSGGYHEELVQATEPGQPGLTALFHRLGEVIKSRQRRLYIRNIGFRHIDAVSWHMKCEMARLLLQRCRPEVMSRFRSCSPEQMADHVLELLVMDLVTDNQLGRTGG